MRKLIVNEFVSMDGVAQAPGGREKTPRAASRTAAGTWRTGRTSGARAWVMKYIAEMGGLVLGRAPTRSSPRYWPNAPEEESVVAEPFNRLPKYVASTTLTEPLAWNNSSLLRPDVATALRALKQEDGGDRDAR